MRKFIISDIHGLGNVYYSIMNYLDNRRKNEEITLYINGDLFDRGLESAELLLDVVKRIRQGQKIVYLGGNHELLMHQFYKDYLKKGEYSHFNNWYDNGGYITDDNMHYLLNYDFNKVINIVNFISNLKLYHKFSETINNKQIVLVHAKCPEIVNDKCELKIKDDNELVFDTVWSRDLISYIPEAFQVPKELGNIDYFTIVGHTPNDSPFGYEYHRKSNYLNIDGGCARYAGGLFEYDHVPLLEIKDGYLKILTFNNNNEIISGHYFDGKINIPYSEDELNKEREFLNQDLKVKKLCLLEDDIVGYK